MIGASIITMEEREGFRAAIKEFNGYILAAEKELSGKGMMDVRTRQYVTFLSQTTELPNQIRALRSMHDAIDKEYDEHLLYAAPFKLSQFCEYMFRSEPPVKHHEFIIEHMELIHTKEILRLSLSTPPGAAKSSFASIRFPAWHLGRRPDDRWVQGAHTQTFAKDRLGKPVRSLIAESRYRQVFPEMGISSTSSAADYFEFSGGHRGYYKAVGVGTGIAGYRFEIGGIDDPIASREDAESPSLPAQAA